MVRAALPASARAHREYVQIVRDMVQGASSLSSSTAVTTTCRTRGPTAWASASRCARPCTRCAPRSRSTSAPRVRGTCGSRPRSATAGCRCSSPQGRRVVPRTARRGLRRQRRPDQVRAVRGGLDADHHPRRRRRGVRRPDASVRRALRGRHGSEGRQLPLRRVRPHGVGGHRHAGAGAVPARQEARGCGAHPGRDGGGRTRSSDRSTRSATTWQALRARPASRPCCSAAAPTSSRCWPTWSTADQSRSCQVQTHASLPSASASTHHDRA